MRTSNIYGTDMTWTFSCAPLTLGDNVIMCPLWGTRHLSFPSRGFWLLMCPLSSCAHSLGHVVGKRTGRRAQTSRISLVSGGYLRCGDSDEEERLADAPVGLCSQEVGASTSFLFLFKFRLAVNVFSLLSNSHNLNRALQTCDLHI